jgi:uncharacterized membrane protein (DUF4010 family)
MEFALESPYLISLLVATGIGLIIGLEREFRKGSDQDHFAGIRTFALVAIAGCVVAFIGQTLTPWLVVGALVAFIILISAAYYLRTTVGHPGITTEVSLVITFLLGVMTSLQLYREALAAAVVTTTLLSLKGKMRTLIAQLTEEEMLAFIKFIIVCLLLFPFLPDQDVGPDGLLNPREVGWIVVIVSALNFLGYLLMKFVGATRGILLMAALGGLFSSTAVTWVFANRSQADASGHAPVYAAGVTLASSIMFLRVALISLIFSQAFFGWLLVPCAIMAATGLLFTYWYTRHKPVVQGATALELSNPTQLLNALGFGVLYVAIGLLVHYANQYFGDRGLLISGLVAGLTDVDAITIRMAQWHPDEQLALAVLVVLLAVVSNTLVKTAVCLVRGHALMRWRVTGALLASLASGLVYWLAAR